MVELAQVLVNDCKYDVGHPTFIWNIRLIRGMREHWLIHWGMGSGLLYNIKTRNTVYRVNLHVVLFNKFYPKIIFSIYASEFYSKSKRAENHLICKNVLKLSDCNCHENCCIQKKIDIRFISYFVWTLFFKYSKWCVMKKYALMETECS